MDSNVHQDALMASNLFIVKEEPLDEDEELPLHEQEMHELEVRVQESIQKILYPMYSSIQSNGIVKIESDPTLSKDETFEIVKTDYAVAEDKSLNNPVNEGIVIYSACYKCQRIFSSKEKLLSHLKKCRSDLRTEFFIKHEHGTVNNHSENEDSNPDLINNNSHNLWLSSCSPENSSSGGSKNSEVSSQVGNFTRSQVEEDKKKLPPKKFQCQLCQKSFARPYKLTAHMRTHTGERPYACTFENCGKRFGSKAVLKNHLFTHTGLKSYSCNYCTKTFRDRPSQQEHERVHTLELPFVCDLCGRGFSRNRNLKRHITEVHSVNKKKSLTINETKVQSTPVEQQQQEQDSSVSVSVSSTQKTGQFQDVEENFACDSCDKTFQDQTDLNSHLTECHRSPLLSTTTTVSLPATTTIVFKEEILS